MGLVDRVFRALFLSSILCFNLFAQTYHPDVLPKNKFAVPSVSSELLVDDSAGAAPIHARIPYDQKMIIQKKRGLQQPNFRKFSAEDFYAYFHVYQQSSERDVLAYHQLYHLPAFQYLIKSYALYDNHIIDLYNTFIPMWRIGRGVHIVFHEDYNIGFEHTICALHADVVAASVCKHLDALPYKHRDKRFNAVCSLKKPETAARVKRTSDVSAKVCNYAQQYSIAIQDLTHTKMNAYEYQLHTEFIEQLTQVADLAHVCKDNNKTFILDAVGHSVVHGIEANKEHHLIVATQWANVGWELLEIAKGVAEGVALGAVNTACFIKDVVWHPQETVTSAISGVGTIVGTVAKLIYAYAAIQERVEAGDYIAVMQMCDKVKENLFIARDTCKEVLDNVSKRGAARYGAACAIECLLTEKAFRLCHALCIRAAPLVQAFIRDVLRSQEVVELAIAGAEGSREASKLRVLMQEGQKVKQPAQALGVEAPKVVGKVIRPLVPTWVDIERLREKFNNYVRVDGRAVHIDYEHLFSFSEICKKKRSGHIQSGRLYGGHHDYGNALKKAGVIEHTNVVEGVCGAFKSEPIINGVKYSKEKTFFPSSWTEEKVVETIYDVFKREMNNGNFVVDGSGHYIIEGATKESLKVQIFFDPNKSCITSAFPLMKNA